MMPDINWNKYKNFQKWEFDCKHTGENKMRPEFLDLLQQIRTSYRKPMVISSGYRHWTHPVEIKKNHYGAHTYGVAADILVHSEDAQELLILAYGYGVRRFGLQQKGGFESRYIHIDIGDQLKLGFTPSLWTY